MKKTLSIITTLLLILLVSSTSFAQEITTKYDTPLDKSWDIKFNMDIDDSTLNSNNVFITDSNGSKIDCKVSLADTGETDIITISPNNKYLSGNKYTLYVKDIKSANGNSLKEKVTMDFITVKSNQEMKVYKSSNYFEKDYIEIEVIDNEKIKIKGRSDLNKIGWLLLFNGNVTLKEVGDVKADGTYEGIVNIDEELTDGDYQLGVYFKDKDDTTYWSYYWGIPLKCNSGELSFSQSPVYENNYVEDTKNLEVYPKQYLNIEITDNAERKEIQALAKDIVIGVSSDYEKLLKINNWVSENIYYDWDGYLSGVYGRNDAYITLKSRKAVCQGYAELTDALLKSAGIPSRVVTGHALGVSASGGYWDEVDHSVPNHAWNEAFVDGRWIIIDTTWNSGNKYENGEFIKGDMNYRYFDPTLEVFSYDHKIIGDE